MNYLEPEDLQNNRYYGGNQSRLGERLNTVQPDNAALRNRLGPLGGQPSNLQTRLNTAQPDNAALRARLDQAKAPSSSNLQNRLNTVQPNNAATRAKLGPLGSKYMGPEMPSPNNVASGSKPPLTKGNMVKNPALSSAPILNAIGADQYNQAELERNINKGDLGLGTGIRGIASLASRAPQYFAGAAADSLQDNPYLKGVEGLAKKGFEALGDNSIRDSLADVFYALDPAGIRDNTPSAEGANITPETTVDGYNAKVREDANNAQRSKYQFDTDQGLADFVNSDAYREEMAKAGINVGGATVPSNTAPNLGGALPAGPRNVYGENINTIKDPYTRNGVTFVPWEDEAFLAKRLMPSNQYIDYMGQGNVEYDEYGKPDGKPVSIPKRVNPALNPDIIDMERQRLAMQMANANQPMQPRQTKFSPAFNDNTLYESLPPDINPEIKQRVRTIPKQAWQEFEQDIASSNSNDKENLISQFSIASGIDPSVLKNLLYR